MDPTQSEIVRFLAHRAPFDALAVEELAEVAQETEIEFHLPGARILTEDGGPVTFLRVIHSGAVDIAHEGKLLDLLGPGDAFGHAAMLAGLPPGFEARAAEDTLCYRIPVSVARPLLERARRRELQVGTQDPAHQAVAELIRSPTLRVEPTASISKVAQQMTELGTTCAVIDLPKGGFGIVTDRDFRTRIVARGLSFGAPVGTVMSAPAFSVTPDRLGGEVLFEMIERAIRHVLIVSKPGELVGVVDDIDLFAAPPRSWFGVRQAIARAQDMAALAAAAARVSEIVVDLHASNLRALEIARVVSTLVDALTVRALEIAARGKSLPADGLVWIALGSQARRELTPASVARGAIVYSDAPPRDWIQSVGQALGSCGMSKTVVTRSGEEWLHSDYDDELTLMVLVERRMLWGIPREPLPTADGEVRAAVLSALRRRALAYRPPTGFDADAVLEADGTRREKLDIRRAAVIPIVELARWAGAAAGLTGGSTQERLFAAAAAGVLADADARTLADAFELAMEQRIVHHLEQLAASSPANDLLDPRAISPLRRDHLRDVFRAVGGVQRKLLG